ncbi:MAG: hypothetical protein WKF78_06810 [Candidatus Limnocylindrales bacterium]
MEPFLALIIVAVIGNLVLMTALIVPPWRARARAAPSGDESAEISLERMMAEAAVTGGEDEPSGDGVPVRTYDRVVRIVSWVFLLTTTIIVAVSGLWAPNQPAILTLLALAGLFVLVIHDLMPSQVLGAAKFIVEGSVAITVATLLVALTGGSRARSSSSTR